MRAASGSVMRLALLVSAALVAAASCSPTSSSSPADPGGEPGSSTGDAEQPVARDDAGDGRPAAADATSPQPSKPCVANVPPSAPADVAIDVDAARGQHGPAPAKVDRRIYGMNVADWHSADYAPVAQPKFQKMLRALRPGVLRWPAGHRSQEYVWERGGAGQSGDWTLTAAHVDAFVALAKSVGAEPLIALNVKRSTAAAMADLVHYLDVEKKYGVRWFLVGNEPDLTDGIIGSPEAYAAKLVEWGNAVRAVDPKARLIAPELLTGAHVNGVNGTVNWLSPVLSAAGGFVDGVSWHYYPLDSAQANPSSSAIMSVPHLFQETAPDWPPASIAYADEVMPALAATGKGVWITEFAEDPGPAAGLGISETVAGALWVGDAFGRYAEYAPEAIIRWVFKSGEHAYAILGEGDVPKPAYGAHWLYARHMGDRYVKSTSSEKTAVAAHAALRGDDRLSVMLVNKTTAPKKVHVAIDGFCVGSASEITLTGDGYGATAFTVNGEALTDANVESLGPSPSASLYETELPPTSIRVLVYAAP